MATKHGRSNSKPLSHKAARAGGAARRPDAVRPGGTKGATVTAAAKGATAKGAAAKRAEAKGAAAKGAEAKGAAAPGGDVGDAPYAWGAARYRPAMTFEAARAAIDAHLGARVRLADYRDTITPLTPDERELLLDQAQKMLEFLYVHLPLKRALYASDPIQRLRLLRLGHAAMDERAFQSAMIDVFVGLRDLHTNYVLPAAYGSKFAFLPFRVEEFYEPGGGAPAEEQRRGYVVTWVSPVSPDPRLRKGAVVSHWNGSPVALAVARNADREAGSNPEARRARGVEALTLRWLGSSLPPDEDWVDLTYSDSAGGAPRESRFYWEVVDSDDLPDLLSGMDAGAAGVLADEATAISEAAAADGGAAEGAVAEAVAAAEAAGGGTAAVTAAVVSTSPGVEAGWGIDWKTVLLQRARELIFDAAAIELGRKMSAYSAQRGGVVKAVRACARGPSGEAADGVPGPPVPAAEASLLPDVYPRFGAVDTPSGKFGYVRLQTFAPKSRDIDGAVEEFARILRTLPPGGLILDVRGNGGGYINFGERILQMLTPGPITPEPFHFVATELTREMAAHNPTLSRWADPIRLGISTGSTFSQGFPLTDPTACNSVGQVYQGPVVLIIDAFCYSTTDIFAAGFQDHRVGFILGTHNATGAGGANVWDHADLVRGFSFATTNPFRELPQRARMRVAARRSTRLNERSGVPVEDLGVTPDGLYFMTRADVLEHNRDLIAHAAAILKTMETQSLDFAPPGAAPVASLDARWSNIDRIDVLLDGRPVLSSDVAPGAAGSSKTIALPTAAPAGTVVVLNGYRDGVLVASRRAEVS